MLLRHNYLSVEKRSLDLYEFQILCLYESLDIDHNFSQISKVLGVIFNLQMTFSHD